MQNNSQGRRDRVDPKIAPTHEEPNSRGLRAETPMVDEAAPAEVMKTFTAGVVTDCMRLYVRKDPSADGEVVTVIDCLSKVMVDMEGSTDEFYKVCTASGAEGFCMRKYIALKR